MRSFFNLVFIVVLMSFGISGNVKNDQTNLIYGKFATKAADAFLKRNADHVITYKQDRNNHKWQYEQGLMLTALYEAFLFTGDSSYYNFMVNNIAIYVNENGDIDTYKQTNFKLDDIVPGRALLTLFSVTKEPKYKIAADKLRHQLEIQPRTNEGGFWHKKIYPYQMWLDGLYMALPFYGRYGQMFDEPENFDDIVNQFIYAEKHCYDPGSGLLYHGWDESKKQEWADPETGVSSNFWGRAMGWYLMALVDVLDILPADHIHRKTLIDQLNKYSSNLMKYRNDESKVWYQVLDQGDRQGNYLESSATAMYIYAFTKGVNMGYLDKKYLTFAKESWAGFLKQFITMDEAGLLTINNTCSSAGLGGKTKRDGSFEYYLSEPQRSNDCKAIGPFILAAIELEKSAE